MSVAKLIGEYSKRAELPIDVPEILNDIRALGVADTITFFRDLELDTRIISGFFKREERVVNGQKLREVKITYGKMGHEMERVVCCKELIHVLDPPKLLVSTRGQVEHLIEKITLPADLVDPFDGDDVWNDRLALLEALALLFPLEARKTIYAAHMKGSLTIEEIAELAEIPVGYARYVMNGMWPHIHERLILRRRRVEDRVKPRKTPSKVKPPKGAVPPKKRGS